MKRSLILIILFIGLVLVACQPRSAVQVDTLPPLLPDYTEITIPPNIAPLNFQVEGAHAVTAVISGKEQYTYTSRTALLSFPLRGWRKMLEAERGNTLSVQVVAVNDRNEALTYSPFHWQVAEEPIDPYLSYRLIEPAYEIWNMLQIEERDVTSFHTRTLSDNNITDHSCINCHTVQRGAVNTSFMHVRGSRGGTIYSQNGKLRKINTKTPQTGTAVYGELTADGRYGIFTTAEIIPILHSYRTERLEVYDKESDLILIDFQTNTVTTHPSVTGEEFQETFPCFAPDGRTIYFCRAPHLPQPENTRDVRYDLYSIAFSPDKGLGDSLTLVFDAAARGKSVSFPKVSPDGQFLLFTVSDYGTFPIWHPETDLWMLNLATGEVNELATTNGRFSDSYHSWSSNSRWITFASKRDDRVYGRPYFAYVQADGGTTKAFVLPQKDPAYYGHTFKSFNIPELYSQPETYDAHDIRSLYFDGEAESLTYEQQP